MSAEQRRYYADTIARYLMETERAIRQCRDMLAHPDTIAHLSAGKINNACQMFHYAEDLRMWLSQRRN